MSRLPLLTLLLIAACPHQAPNAAPDPAPRRGAASLLLHNGVIFTARDEREVAEALAVAGGKVVGVGTRRELRRFEGAGTRVVDLRGRFVCPGFADAHLHLQAGGRSLTALNLRGVTSLAAALEAVRRKVATARPGHWITGGGWDHTLWEGQRWPTRLDLDRVAPDNPVLLSRVDGHVAWANTRALTLSKIDAKTPNPPGGAIVRDAGGPTGILKEAAADLVRPVAEDQPRHQIALALQKARELGVTSFHDIDSDLEELIRLRDAGQLTARVYKMARLGTAPARLRRWRRRLSRRGDDLLAPGALKGFVDGTLGSSTAALLEPYADSDKQTGTFNHTRQELERLVTAATRHGFQVALHAIGDGAVRRALRAFAATLPHGGKARRHRLEHVQVIHPDDLPALRRAGAVASIQPCHLVTDQRWVEQRLGRTRAKERGYPWRSLGTHATLALGTDWPVEPLSPLRNLYAATTRRRIGPDAGAGWNVAQRLTRGQALRAYTYGSAHAAHAERRRGTLAPGMDADLVVVDRDLLRAGPQRLLEARVLATVLAGRVVYGSL